MATVFMGGALAMLVGVLALVPVAYGQMTDASGRRITPALDAPADPTNPSVDLVFTPVTPCRVCDTRSGEPDAGGCAKGAVSGGGSRDVVVAGFCGVPAGASAVSVNLTVVPTAGGPGDLRIAPNPPGALPLASIINYQNFGVVANAADVPIGTGVRLFADGASTNFILDVMGYYRDVSCQAGTVKTQGQCWETALRAATDIFSASEACGGLPGRGRLGNGLQLRALNILGTLALAAPPGEWTDNLYFDTSGAGFTVITIANDNGFGVQDTLGSLPYRCVFNGIP